MERHRRPKEPMPLESFERALEEEMALSAEFDLPLTLLVVRAKTGLDPETTRRLLGVFRTAEFLTLPTPSELAVILPNTGPEGARAVERRVREVLPDADVGQATREPGDEVYDLLERARGLLLAAHEPYRPSEPPAALVCEREVSPPGIEVPHDRHGVGVG